MLSRRKRDALKSRVTINTNTDEKPHHHPLSPPRAIETEIHGWARHTE